jgi:pSer/pThr/pTyr-binding forkhead associated (FHA) protein
MLLEVVTPTGKASTVALDTDSLDVGTGDTCRVRIADPAVAKCHARISRHVDTGKYFILDLGSARGTEVNGELIVRYGPLGDADIISIGSHKLKMLPDAQVRRQRPHRHRQRRPLLRRARRMRGTVRARQSRPVRQTQRQ